MPIDNMNVVIIDTEVENHPWPSGPPGTPANKLNYVVSLGITAKQYDGFYFHSKQDWIDNADRLLEPLLQDVQYIVCHNVGYDYLWLVQLECVQAFLIRGGVFLDTQWLEAAIHGFAEDSLMTSLDDLAPGYGGTLKNDYIKDCWNSGMLTSEIQEDVLMEYMKGDVLNTAKVFQAQWRRVELMAGIYNNNFIQTIIALSEGFHFIYECQANGAYMDKTKGLEDVKELWEEEAVLEQAISDTIEDPEIAEEFNVRSTHNRSALFYGGAIKIPIMEPRTKDGKTLYESYKFRAPKMCGNQPIIMGSGEIQYVSYTVRSDQAQLKKGFRLEYLPRLVDPTAIKGADTSLLTQPDGKPVWSTGKETRDQLGHIKASGKALAAFSEVSQNIRTFYITPNGQSGALTKVDEFNMVYTSLNTNSTVTSRMSSSKPNLQNPTRLEDSLVRPGKLKSHVRELLQSRFEDGKIVEPDYSQIEKVVEAALTKDKQYMKDIAGGLDAHTMNLSLSHYKVSAKNYWLLIKAKVFPKRNKSDKKSKKPMILTYEEIMAIREAPEVCPPEANRIGLARTHIKGFGFADQYAAGMATLMAQSGLTRNEIDQIKIRKAARWPGIDQYFDRLLTYLKNHIKYDGKMRTGKGCKYPMEEGYTYWPSPFGLIFRFDAAVSPCWKRRDGTGMTAPKLNFNPSILKNKPSQSGAAIVIHLAMARVFREFVKRGWVSWNPDAPALMILIVHDALVADCQEDIAVEVGDVMKRIMEKVDEYVFEVTDWNMGLRCPVKVDIADHLP